MIYSVQQIKYDIMACVKEIDGRFDAWTIGLAADPKAALRAQGVDLDADCWMYRQALSRKACLTVQTWFVDRLGVRRAERDPDSEDVDCVFVYRRGAVGAPDDAANPEDDAAPAAQS